jgi:hypothetical protein
MKIGLYMLENKFPNLAAMKVSAYHRNNGDTVERYFPLMHDYYDKIYCFSVFTFTNKNTVTPDMICGGTGFNSVDVLPECIEHELPDYSLYPEFKHAIGFITRGCPNKCKWCIVPKKEGAIRPNLTAEEIIGDKKSAVFLDNNVLACDHGITQIESIRDMRVKVDFNQGLDARLIDAGIANILAGVKWIKFVRLACDTSSQIASVDSAVSLLRRSGLKAPIMSYLLVKNGEIEDALYRAEMLKRMGVDPFAQPYRDYENEVKPDLLSRQFARWVNIKAAFKSMTYKQFLKLNNVSSCYNGAELENGSCDYAEKVKGE